MAGMIDQPELHRLTTVVAAPCLVLSRPDGQIDGTGAQGVYVADVRVLSVARLSIGGAEPHPLSHSLSGPSAARSFALVRDLGTVGPDPSVWVRRTRTARPDGVDESVELENRSDETIDTTVDLVLVTDLAELDHVRAGGTTTPVPWQADGGRLRAGNDDTRVEVECPGAELTAAEPAGPGVRVRWRVRVPARSTGAVGYTVRVRDTGAVVTAAAPPHGPGFTVSADDHRLAPFLARSIADLGTLRMAAPDRPADVFYAAGSPWYLTLFGRDSLWSARMALPLGTDVAGGTLRALAARQGTRYDDATGEQPGKILHEVRRPRRDAATAFLPPVYYGTVDATPLWITLLAEAWRWGLDPAEVRALLPALERALQWMVTDGDTDGDGFLEYVDDSGRGLSNQGWKDSGDSIRFADGRIAQGSVALAEVQGYAHQAARDGAELLTAFGRPGAEGWRDWAAGLADRFRARFWVADGHGRYPALALDGEKRPVDAPASNMGHLLGTGLLDAAEAAEVADRLTHPSLSSGFGLRTMADTAGGYSPLSYHCGSVWPHDTAIAVHGLLRSGLGAHAAVLARGLLAAGDAFDGRVPELYGGFGVHESGAPVPYPASCRPQAWSAAAAVTVVQAALGLTVDVPAGVVRVDPAPAFGAVQARGIVVGGYRLDVGVGADGTVTAHTDHPGLTVVGTR